MKLNVSTWLAAAALTAGILAPRLAHALTAETPMPGDVPAQARFADPEDALERRAGQAQDLRKNFMTPQSGDWAANQGLAVQSRDGRVFGSWLNDPPRRRH